MPTYPEIVRSVQAAWLLARGDTRGMARLRPLGRRLLEIVRRRPGGGPGLRPGPARPVPRDRLARARRGARRLAELVSFAVGWLAFPLAAIPLTRLLGLSARYVPLIVANNWSAVIQVALYTAVVLVGTILPTELRTLALLAATIVGPGLPVVRDPHRARDHAAVTASGSSSSTCC